MATKKASKEIIGRKVIFKWADETTDELSLDELSDEMIVRAALHGLSQKGGDSYSQSTSVAEAKAMFYEVKSAIYAGDWNRKGGASGGIYVEALARATGNTIEDALIAWNKMDDATKAATKKHPDLKAAKAEIELERAKAAAKASKASKSVDVKPLTI